MTFQDKYISEAENAITPNIKKIEISNESYAICEMLDELIYKLNNLNLTKW